MQLLLLYRKRNSVKRIPAKVIANERKVESKQAWRRPERVSLSGIQLTGGTERKGVMLMSGFKAPEPRWYVSPDH